jgi:hypothetical protein
MFQSTDPVAGFITTGRVDYAAPTLGISGDPVSQYGPKFAIGLSHQFIDPVLGAGEFIYLPLISTVLPGYAVVYNFNPVTTNLAFSAAVASGATSGALFSAFTGTSGSYNINFSNGNQRTVTLTNGSTAVSWAGQPTTSASTANVAASPASTSLLNGAAAATVALAAAGTRGNVAIATVGYDASVGGVQYAWHQVEGAGLVYASAAIAANAVIYPTTAGQVAGTVSATNKIDGLSFPTAVIGASLAYGMLNYPVMQATA